MSQRPTYGRPSPGMSQRTASGHPSNEDRGFGGWIVNFIIDLNELQFSPHPDRLD